jgi:hypothetical protein
MTHPGEGALFPEAVIITPHRLYAFHASCSAMAASQAQLAELIHGG